MRLLLLAILLASTPAFAGGKTPDERADRILGHLDVDRDGKISRAEADKAERLRSHFDRIDADRDGYLTRAEILAAIERARDKRAK